MIEAARNTDRHNLVSPRARSRAFPAPVVKVDAAENLVHIANYQRHRSRSFQLQETGGRMTFTVIARDEEKGLLGVAISTSALSVGGRCPFVRANVGAVSTQAYTDPGI